MHDVKPNETNIEASSHQQWTVDLTNEGTLKQTNWSSAFNETQLEAEQTLLQVKCLFCITFTINPELDWKPVKRYQVFLYIIHLRQSTNYFTQEFFMSWYFCKSILLILERRQLYSCTVYYWQGLTSMITALTIIWNVTELRT